VNRRTGSAEIPSPEHALAQFLKPYDPAVQALAAGLRALVRSELAPCYETIYDAGYTISLLYGPSTRVSEGICYISVHRQHVNLGFQRGSLLENPNGVLRGDGAWMRHIQVKSRADLDRPELRAFLRAACAEADHTPSASPTASVVSTVKRSQAKKRRTR
jgi:hypothetical protein